MSNIYEDLQNYFGYSSFLPYQEEIITDVINKKDVLAVLATGGGKSICYQLPSVHMDGVTIVISPLKALMKDQVDTLTAHGIPAATINSSNYSEHRRIMDDARAGRLKLIYVSPERIVQESFMDFLCSLTLSLIAVDEAHCISMWGHNFRPEYRELQTIHTRFPRVPMVALTATAIPQVRNDIILQLGLRDPTVYLGSFHRKNLHYAVRPKNKKNIQEIISYLSAHPDDSGIIYCLSRKTTEEVAAKLRQNGFNAHHFHASLTTAEKEKIQDKFIKGEIPIICATIAFGMGIDKPDVRFVIHYDLPKNLESYYQETGRAGRDGDPSDCILFYGRGDIVTRRMMIENDSYTDPVQLKNAYHKLNDLIDFAESPECRKVHLMRYFGEELSPEDCSGCDICDSPSVSIDGKEIASTAYRCIEEVNGKFGITTIAEMLIGSKSKKILSRNLDRYHSYDSGTGHSGTEWKDYLFQLTAMGYFGVSDSEYPVISLTEKSPDINNPAVQIALRKSGRATDTRRRDTSHLIEDAGDPELFAALKKKRLELAKEENVPPFVIMLDRTLRAISAHMPATEEGWAAIPGISLGKYQKYGEPFTEVIRQYQAHAGDETPDHLCPTGKQDTDIFQTIPEPEIIRETPSLFATTTEEEIDWVDAYIDRIYPNGCSPVANAQKTKKLAFQGMNPGEIAATSGYSIKTITKHLLDLTLSKEMDAWECVSPFLNEQHFMDIAATLRAVTEEEAEPEVLPHLKRFYSDTEFNITLIRLLHDKIDCHTPSFPELTDSERNSSHPIEFLPLLPDTTSIFTYDTLTEDLTNGDHSIRKRAVKMLGYLGEPEAITPLVVQLEREEKDSVKAEIIRALTSLRDCDHPKEISHYLHDNAPSVCSASIGYLKQSCPKYIFPEIQNLLNNPSDTVRKLAVWILDECPGQDATDWLYDIIENDSSGYIRATAAHILGKNGNIADYSKILGLMNDADTGGYAGVIAGLAACGGENAIPDITDHLDSDQEPVRKAAITALVDLNPSAISDLCQRVQDDSSAGVRSAFVRKIGTVSNAKAEKMVRSFASDPSPYVREAVACSLKKTTYTASVACLQSLLSDRSPIVRRYSYEALLNLKNHYL